MFEQIDAETAAAEKSVVGSATMGELLDSSEEMVLGFEEGKIVRGKISEIRENEIIVDVGFKSEGTIPVNEFSGLDEMGVGAEFDVYLEKLENQDGLVVLSKEKADFFKVWGAIKDAHEDGSIMRGTVRRRIKGGLVVDLVGVDAFLPGSQIALRQVPNLDELLGQELEFKIIKINKRRRNIVISRRVVLEEQRAELKRELMAELEVGQVREGVVKNITDFGAFVDLGGVDGLLHLTDITWGRIGHPSEVVQIGETLQVKVLDFDKEKEKISLGLKQLQPYPWEGVDQRFPVGTLVPGRVVSITDYGAFVELEKGVEGLVHISEMSWTRHVKHPSKIVSVGQEIQAMVLRVDQDNQKISLGLKQTEPDPWTTIGAKYPSGTRIHGVVRNLTNFGAFVEIEDGIDGLLHISDMSWARRVRHPSEVVKKGDSIDVIVLEVNQEKKRISLGMKQLTENPWEQLAIEFAVDTEVEGKITRTLDRGAVVELRADVEGFVPVAQMGFEDIVHPDEYFEAGDTVPLVVIKVDPKNKRIVLSITAWLNDRTEDEVTAFKAKHPRRSIELPEDASDAPRGAEHDAATAPADVHAVESAAAAPAASEGSESGSDAPGAAPQSTAANATDADAESLPGEAVGAAATDTPEPHDNAPDSSPDPASDDAEGAGTNTEEK